MSSSNVQTATFAGGCFWCTEAIFKRLKGVVSVVSGYTGGDVESPTYEDVSSGNTGHAEAIQITFDPTIISYEQLLNVFWATHDPTTRNRQGNDVGTQYRSAIFFHSEEQKKSALESIALLEKEKNYTDPIVTDVTEFTKFYPAEAYHKEYFDTNRTAPYCKIIIDPKVQKFMRQFKNVVKEEYK